MSQQWNRESSTCIRLDEVWTVRRDRPFVYPGWWHAFRGEEQGLAAFGRWQGAAEEAEKLRDEDKLYVQ